MFEVPKTAVTSWEGYANYSNVFVPVSVDIGCPHCRRTPINFALTRWEVRSDSLFSASRCPGCGETSRFWIIDFWAEDVEAATKNCKIYLFPTPPIYQPFDEEIGSISPTFIEVYNQAAQAEMIGLDKLTGVGYRKALEFLIKDWASRKNPDKVDEIQSMLLGPCIQYFVDDQRVKECAERAVWLGNDETHYVRKWIDKDLDDLKLLLTLTIYWISSSLITERYIAGMTRKK